MIKDQDRHLDKDQDRHQDKDQDHHQDKDIKLGDVLDLLQEIIMDVDLLLDIDIDKDKDNVHFQVHTLINTGNVVE